MNAPKQLARFGAANVAPRGARTTTQHARAPALVRGTLSKMPATFYEKILGASNVVADADNRLQIDGPTFLEPNDAPGFVAAQAVVGGLTIGAWPGDSSETQRRITAAQGGRLFLPYAGWWRVRVLRFGTGATGTVGIPFAFQRLEPAYTIDRGAFPVLPSSQQALSSSVAMPAGAITLVTLAQMLNGTVAVAVRAGVNPITVRWGSAPTGILWDQDIAANARYVFKGEELPLADLQAIDAVGPASVVKVSRYLR